MLIIQMMIILGNDQSIIPLSVLTLFFSFVISIYLIFSISFFLSLSISGISSHFVKLVFHPLDSRTTDHYFSHSHVCTHGGQRSRNSIPVGLIFHVSLTPSPNQSRVNSNRISETSVIFSFRVQLEISQMSME